MFQKQITKEELAELPLKAFEGQVEVIENEESFYKFLPEIEKAKVLGFDTETKPIFKKGKTNNNKVALLQLSTYDTAYLIRLNKIGLPDELTAILANENIIKVGAAVRDDLRYLAKLNPFTPAGFIDLQKMVKKFGIESASLKKMTAIVLKFRISKNQQLSNWENGSLTPAQQRYAATDAWVCHQIFKKLSNGKN